MKVEIKFETNNLQYAVMAMTYVSSIVLLGTPPALTDGKWHNLHEWGNASLVQIGQFRIKA